MWAAAIPSPTDGKIMLLKELKASYRVDVLAEQA